LNLPALPCRDPLRHFMTFYFRDHVEVLGFAHDTERLSAAELYVLSEASRRMERHYGRGVSWRIHVDDWPELVRLVELSATAPMQAIFSAWVNWSAGDLPCLQIQTYPLPDHGRVEGADV